MQCRASGCQTTLTFRHHKHRFLLTRSVTVVCSGCNCMTLFLILLCSPILRELSPNLLCPDLLDPTHLSGPLAAQRWLCRGAFNHAGRDGSTTSASDGQHTGQPIRALSTFLDSYMIMSLGSRKLLVKADQSGMARQSVELPAGTDDFQISRCSFTRIPHPTVSGLLASSSAQSECNLRPPSTLTDCGDCGQV